MFDRIWTRHPGLTQPGLAAICFGATGALIYAVMISVTLAHIETISGQVPFDMRPLGYGPRDAAALLEGLGSDGRIYYLTRQIPLDTAYPALLGLTLVSILRWCAQTMPATGLVRIGVLCSIGAAVCDYAENFGIITMILGWPDLADPVVYASSAASVAKSVLTTAAVMFVILIGGLAARHRIRRAV